MKSSVIDAPAERKGVALSPLSRAVLEWIMTLPGRPVMKQGGVDSGRGRNIDEALVMCYVRDITKAGLQAFGEMADEVHSFFMLQKAMTKRLITLAAPTPVDRRQLLREKLAEANATWNCIHSCSSSSSISSSVSSLSPTSDPLTPRSTRKVTFELN